jgi:hypothetical protein
LYIFNELDLRNLKYQKQINNKAYLKTNPKDMSKRYILRIPEISKYKFNFNQIEELKKQYIIDTPLD